MIASTSEADGDRVRVEHVRDPGRVVPRPPDHEEHEQRPAGPAPRQVAEQQMRHLRDGEHEDEVVEQLEVRGVLLLVSPGAGSGSSPRHVIRPPGGRMTTLQLVEGA